MHAVLPIHDYLSDPSIVLLVGGAGTVYKRTIINGVNQGADKELFGEKVTSAS